MVVPLGAPGFREDLRYVAETFHVLKNILKKRGLATGIGDEGGFAPNLNSNEDAIEIIIQAIEMAGYKPGEDIAIALDSAANSFSVDIRRGLEEATADSTLIKLNQIGTVSETIDAVRMSRYAGWHYFISHRSGETEDTLPDRFCCCNGWGAFKDWLCKSR